MTSPPLDLWIFLAATQFVHHKLLNKIKGDISFKGFAICSFMGHILALTIS